MKLMGKAAFTFLCVVLTSVSAIPISSDFYRFDDRNITPFSSSRMNMGERGDILEWYGGEDTEPIYLDEDDDEDQEQIAAPNQDDESLTNLYLFPVVKKSSGNYRMNHLVRLDKKSPDNYRMNHLVRFRVKKASPGYLTRQLRNDKTNVWNKILNRI